MTCKYKSTVTKKKAFTLIELLIVIAIIGILFIVLVSKVDFATDKAKATGVQTDFRSFQLALETVSKEKAGFNSFGWNTGDANANGVRDSVDEGDANEDGVYQSGETWTGHKKYLETWTNTYSLIRPGTTFEADGYDKDAIFALETAINKNLDPTLHITIDAKTGIITMANGAQDPWNTQYHGAYISAEDGMDRGAIVMYSNGANQKFGSEHDIANGVPTVIVPGNNKDGADDYSLVVCYTYINGFGETAAITEGFSNNQMFLAGNGGNVNNDVNININWEQNEESVTVNIPGQGNVNLAIDNNSKIENVVVEKDSNNNTVITATQIPKPIETMNISIGEFKSSDVVIPGTYITVTETVETVVEIPTKYNNFSACMPAMGVNITNEALENLLYNKKYMSDYVVCSVRDSSLQIHYSKVHVSLEDAIYHAAHMRRIWNDNSWYVAQWNGSQYVKLDLSEQINNVTTFSTIEITTLTKQVLVEDAHVDGTVSYIYTGKIMARKDMTWSEWIMSEYNTLGTTNLVIRDSNHNIIDFNDVIDNTKSYVIREIKTFTIDGSASFDFEYGMSWIEFANEKALYHLSRDFTIDKQLNYVSSALFQAICNENNKIDTKFVREAVYNIIEPINYVHKGLNISVSAE